MIELAWTQHTNGDWSTVYDQPDGLFYGTIRILRQPDGNHHHWEVREPSDTGIVYRDSGYNLTLPVAQGNVQNAIEVELRKSKTPIPDILIIQDVEGVLEVRTRLPDFSVGFGTDPGTHHHFVAWRRP